MIYFFPFCGMLLMTVLIVMIVSVALLMALLSGFFPFVNTYGNVVQYTTAYYGAMSAVERGSLAVRYAGPGFDGTSGRKSVKDQKEPKLLGKSSDHKIESLYTYGDGRNSLLWKVTSSTEKIPSVGEGSVDPVFITTNQESRNYNSLDYARTELLPLGTVGTVDANDYYSDKKTFSLSPAGATAIVGTFRLNPLLFTAFGGDQKGKLCESGCPRGSQDRKDTNQVVATRTIKGRYDDAEFTLLPKDGTSNGQQTIKAWDTLIRKQRINQGPVVAPNTPVAMTFGENTHPFDTNGYSELNIISNTESALKNLGTYTKILTDTHVRNPYLAFSLANYLFSQGGNLYPFLEYEFHTTDGTKIADRFYTIQGEGQVGKYNVRLQVKKPTLEQPALGNFTIIF